MADIKIDYDKMKATITPAIGDKGARASLQKKLKEDTIFKGYWTCWFNSQESNNDKLVFDLTNPLLSVHLALGASPESILERTRG